MKIIHIMLMGCAVIFFGINVAKAEMKTNNPGHFTNTFKFSNNPQIQPSMSGNNFDAPLPYAQKNRYQRPPHNRNQNQVVQEDERTQSQDTLSEQPRAQQRRTYQNPQTRARTNAQPQKVNGGMND